MTALQAYLQNSKTRKVFSKKPGEAGFSLIELVVVVAVLAILSAIAIPAFQSISDKARAAAASNTMATIVKECAVKLNDGGGTYNVPTLDGYRAIPASGWESASNVDQALIPEVRVPGQPFVAEVPAVLAGTFAEVASPAPCLSNGQYRLVSDDVGKYPTFAYNTGNGTKSCIVTPNSEASRRGCPLTGGSW